MSARVLIKLLFAVAMLAVVTGGVVSAQSNENSSQTFSGKVSAILGLDETTVRDAMQQARRELGEEKLNARLSKAVESGKITQEQADAKLQWFQSSREEKLKAMLSKAVESGKITQEQADAKFEELQSAVGVAHGKGRFGNHHKGKYAKKMRSEGHMKYSKN